jgi:hypothetical protein
MSGITRPLVDRGRETLRERQLCCDPLTGKEGWFVTTWDVVEGKLESDQM